MVTTLPRTKVSVIMPTHQRAWIINRALKSIYNQTSIDSIELEVIVIDDASKDNSEEVVKDFIKEFSRPNITLQYIKSKHLGKPGLVRNVGLKKATGEYIAYCDSDDIWLPFHIYTCLKQFQLNPDSVMVETWWSQQIIHKTKFNYITCYSKAQSDGYMSTTNSRMHRRDILERSGFFSEEKWGEDLNLWQRIRQLGPVARLKIPTTVNSYNTTGDNISSEYEPRLFSKRIKEVFNLTSDIVVEEIDESKATEREIFRYYRDKAMLLEDSLQDLRAWPSYQFGKVLYHIKKAVIGVKNKDSEFEEQGFEPSTDYYKMRIGHMSQKIERLKKLPLVAVESIVRKAVKK
jgi:glycosyltransferase involved in cell wall biosynthesis